MVLLAYGAGRRLRDSAPQRVPHVDTSPLLG